MSKRLLAMLSIVALLSLGAVTSTSAAASARTPRCAASSLRTWVGISGTAMGTVANQYGFTNRSSSKCSLYGYTHVQLLKKSGANLSTTDQKAPGEFGIKEKVVVLSPGKTAYFGVIYHNQTGYGTLTCPTSAAIRLTPPQQTGTLKLNAHIAAYSGSTEHLVCGVLRITPVTATKFQ